MTDDEKAALEGCSLLLDRYDSLQMATIADDGNPHISYAPFCFSSGCFYILISQLAAHTGHLMRREDVSIVVIADEKESRNLFARERLTISAKAKLLKSDSILASEVLEQMELALGKTVKLLRTLPDFLVFQLVPQQGRYVAGFGKAYEFDLLLQKMEHVGAKN